MVLLNPKSVGERNEKLKISLCREIALHLRPDATSWGSFEYGKGTIEYYMYTLV